MEKPPFKFVEVEWLDANSGSGWEELKDIPQPARVLTRGWLISETLDGITVAGTWSPSEGCNRHEEFNQTISIPNGMLVELRDLELA